MKYLWLLLPFFGFWGAAYLISLAYVGYHWWTIPYVLTIAIAWCCLFLLAFDKMDLIVDQEDK